MKKYSLLIALATVMFLGLGNDSFAQAPTANCHDGGVTCLETEECRFFAADPAVFGSVSERKCVEKTTTPKGNSSQGGNDPCQTCKYTVTSQNPTLNAVDLQKKIDTDCASVCNTPSATSSSISCDVGILKGDINAHVTIPGVSCDCNTGYGEYYDTAQGKTKCGLCTRKDVCCGVKLNTSVPFIGNCLETKDQNPQSSLTEENAFPILMGSLTQILVTAILIISFVLIIIGGIMIATGNPSGGKKMIMKVVIGIALLGASGVILRLINPNFFG